MERIVAKNGVVYYRSVLIPVLHGFSTRIGGVSKLDHTSTLNLGFDRGDDRETVIQNLSLFSEAVGVQPNSIISVKQIHSNIIRNVTCENAGEGFFKNKGESCDGYITSDLGVTLGIRTADCVPILFYAPPNETFRGAVAAIHAGWRGTAHGIAQKAVIKLSDMGADVKEIRVAIGPSISSCCYTVREDFYSEFVKNAGRELAKEFLLPVTAGIWRIDLKSVNLKILLDCGLKKENIDVSDLCTCCRIDEFYSHRASKGTRGTMLSVISMEK